MYRMTEQQRLRHQARVNGQPVKKSKRSKLEDELQLQLERIGVPEFEVDFRFHTIREWRFDFAWQDLKFAVEVDGLVRGGKGGHQTMEGVTADYEKAGEAMLWGWSIYRCTNPMVKSGEAADMIIRLLTRRATEIKQRELMK